jgi:hypothetical protein
MRTFNLHKQKPFKTQAMQYEVTIEYIQRHTETITASNIIEAERVGRSIAAFEDESCDINEGRLVRFVKVAPTLDETPERDARAEPCDEEVE